MNSQDAEPLDENSLEEELLAEVQARDLTVPDQAGKTDVLEMLEAVVADVDAES